MPKLNKINGRTRDIRKECVREEVIPNANEGPGSVARSQSLLSFDWNKD